MGLPDGEELISDLLVMFKTNSFEHSELTQVAKRTLGVNTPKVLSSYVTIGLMSNYAAFMYDIPSNFLLDFATIIDCIMVRLLCPSHFFTDESIVIMDNYLAYVLALANPDQAVRSRFNSQDMYQAGTSQLDAILNPAIWTGKSAKAIASMRPFLIGGRSPSNSGWSTNGVIAFTPVQGS